MKYLSPVLLLSVLSLGGEAETDHSMTRPEQELLAKYLLEQLTSDNPDPILARLARDDLQTQQSQTIATIVPAPPGLDKREEKHKEKCKSSSWSGRMRLEVFTCNLHYHKNSPVSLAVPIFEEEVTK